MSGQRDPFHDPVREAVAGYFQRFADEGFVIQRDPLTAAVFKHLERALVQADTAMADEGLDEDARRRVVTSALYGSVDVEDAVGRYREARKQMELLERDAFPMQFIPRDEGMMRGFGG